MEGDPCVTVELTKNDKNEETGKDVRFIYKVGYRCRKEVLNI